MDTSTTIGWIGTGNMGFPMAARLAKAGYPVRAWNRTRSKAEPLQAHGAEIVDRPDELAGCDIVFTMVADAPTLASVTSGEHGVLTTTRAPRVLIDCSTVGVEASAEARAAAERAGASFLAAPVSGNGKVVKAGRLSLAVSGPRATFEEVLPVLEQLGEGVSYVGEGELARVVKICHNVLLGVVSQCLAEIVVLAEKGGIERHALLDFINKSVMGSTFTRYKTPAFVKLDYAPTFTPPLLRKDLDLGLSLGRELGVPLPITAQTREIVQALIGNGFVDCDFAALLELQARAAGHELVPEDVEVGDGLTARAA